jgi:hypothetical protein
MGRSLFIRLETYRLLARIQQIMKAGGVGLYELLSSDFRCGSSVCSLDGSLDPRSGDAAATTLNTFPHGVDTTAPATAMNTYLKYRHARSEHKWNSEAG